MKSEDIQFLRDAINKIPDAVTVVKGNAILDEAALKLSEDAKAALKREKKNAQSREKNKAKKEK